MNPITNYCRFCLLEKWDIDNNILKASNARGVWYLFRPVYIECSPIFKIICTTLYEVLVLDCGLNSSARLRSHDLLAEKWSNSSQRHLVNVYFRKIFATKHFLVEFQGLGFCPSHLSLISPIFTSEG